MWTRMRMGSRAHCDLERQHSNPTRRRTWRARSRRLTTLPSQWRPPHPAVTSQRPARPARAAPRSRKTDRRRCGERARQRPDRLHGYFATEYPLSRRVSEPNRAPGCSSFARTVNAGAAHGTFRQRETSQLVFPSATTKSSPLGRCIRRNSQEEPQHSASPHASDSDAPSTAHVSSYGRTRKRRQRKRR
ncbi:hypothetical protein EXIGLDRAFT_288769 [Exidia glandulosa HHB12029]|uniref:Uncharacterized protein n=1 Tax=Exidia glandulosa HHB12029 TaxID=1314781 RepID=A0A165DFU0_EXIGL|nr:hypothetical protein EXIGLDRAFT_288769 [Exidia glandulosa HHB12029]